jgi:hypothetical protein
MIEVQRYNAAADLIGGGKQYIKGDHKRLSDRLHCKHTATHQHHLNADKCHFLFH